MKKFTFTTIMERKLREYDSAISAQNKFYRIAMKEGKLDDAKTARELAKKMRNDMRMYEDKLEEWAANGVPTC